MLPLHIFPFVQESGINSASTHQTCESGRDLGACLDKAGGKVKVILVPFPFGMLQNMDL